jgi:hypothetical protein
MSLFNLTQFNICLNKSGPDICPVGSASLQLVIDVRKTHLADPRHLDGIDGTGENVTAVS